MFAWGESQFNLATDGVAHNINGMYASGGYFATLGVRPSAGRLFSEADDRHGCPGVAVLSYSFWNAQYNRGAIANSNIVIEGHPFQIIGVSGPGFSGTEIGHSFDVALPICASEIVTRGNYSLEDRTSWWFRIFGRRKPGLTANQLSARLNVISPQIFSASVPTNWNSVDQNRFLKWKLTWEPAATGFSFLRAQYLRPLQFLMATAVLVLFITCANIASLMLARASARRHEMCVRLAIGASRVRLVRQLLTECVFLSIAGAGLAVLFANWGSHLLVSLISTKSDQIFLDVALDARVLSFTVTVAVLTGILFGLLPAFRSTRVPLVSAMTAKIPGGGRNNARFGSVRLIVAVQIAISIVLVTTSSLLVRSFVQLTSLDSGFDRKGVLLVDVSLRYANLSGNQLSEISTEVLAKVRALPGVLSASESMVIPVGSRNWNDDIVVETDKTPNIEPANVDMNYVTPDYFATLRTPLIRGRDFDERDVVGAPMVVIINEALARRFFPGGDALGKTVRQFESPTRLAPPAEIVGIVRDAKYSSMREDFPPVAYFPFAQLPRVAPDFYAEIRTYGAPLSLARAVEESALSANKSTSLKISTLEQQVDESLTKERLLAVLSAYFGGLALLLALIGLYGVLSYVVLERRKEIGIRVALGAQPSSILRLVALEIAGLILFGAIAGTAITWGTARFVQSLLFGLNANDPRTFALGMGLVAAVATVACYLPVRRAMRVDPLVALRDE